MDSVVFLGGREASTIKEISENWLGKATISMQTEGRSRGQSESYNQNTQRLGRELMTPAELATMPGDRCILQLRGLPPFYSKNILAFLKSEGYFAITPGARCRSKDFYNVYEHWCQGNLEKPLSAKTFLHYLKEHQQALGIVYDEKCVGTSRGFHNVCLTPFVPINDDDPDLPWH